MAHPRVCGELVRSPWQRSKVLRAIPAVAGSLSSLAIRPSFELSHNQAQVSIEPSRLRGTQHPPLRIKQ